MNKLWHKFVDGKDGEPVLWQPPNLPIVLWAIFGLVAQFVHASPWHSIASVISGLSLAVWAIMEIGWGASYFRRALGGLVLVSMILTRLLG